MRRIRIIKNRASSKSRKRYVLSPEKRAPIEEKPTEEVQEEGVGANTVVPFAFEDI